MRHLLFIIILLMLVLLCGALLSYPIYKFLQLFINISFHKLISYVSSICGLLLICVWLKYNNRFNRITLGYKNSAPALITTQVLTGFVAGIIIITVLAITLLLLGIHQFEQDLEFNLVAGVWILLRVLLTGTMVGLIEETLYRGALLGVLLSRMKPLGAVLVSSIVYSAVHFLKFREVPVDVPITWITGVQMLPGAFYRFSDPAIIDSFLSLFAFGVLLAMTRFKYGTLYLCIGLHAGVVTAMKILSKTTNYVPGNDYTFMVSQYGHTLGYLALLWLTLCILIYYRYAFARTGSNNI